MGFWKRLAIRASYDMERVIYDEQGNVVPEWPTKTTAFGDAGVAGLSIDEEAPKNIAFRFPNVHCQIICFTARGCTLKTIVVGVQHAADLDNITIINLLQDAFKYKGHYLDRITEIRSAGSADKS